MTPKFKSAAQTSPLNPRLTCPLYTLVSTWVSNEHLKLSIPNLTSGLPIPSHKLHHPRAHGPVNSILPAAQTKKPCAHLTAFFLSHPRSNLPANPVGSIFKTYQNPFLCHFRSGSSHYRFSLGILQEPHDFFPCSWDYYSCPALPSPPQPPHPSVFSQHGSQNHAIKT